MWIKGQTFASYNGNLQKHTYVRAADVINYRIESQSETRWFIYANDIVIGERSSYALADAVVVELINTAPNIIKLEAE